ncbi:macrophage colony-stimulating factor 1 receptor [Anabrus simplex]|uniref:macrophage colony-stimulating factor 1 receptor n=1 Tax=Anabrus simplex TaxID=316456 RepID=UPI0034DD1F63
MASMVIRTLVFVLWIISAGIHCAHSPTITDPPGEEILIDKGESIELTCKGDGPLDWYYPAAAKKKVSIKTFPGESKFQLKNAEFDDTGYYYCFKKNGTLDDDKMEKDSIYVYVEVFNNFQQEDDIVHGRRKSVSMC